jgi:flavodoxin
MEIIYFTHAKGGNTEILAQKIADRLNLTVNKIVADEPYPTEYDEIAERAKAEHDQDIFPSAQLDGEINDDVLILGTPIWFGELPNVVKRFLKEQVTAPLKIYPFCTSEGSGLGNSENELKEIFPQAEVQQGLAVQGSKVDKADQAVENWLKQLDLI